MTESTHPKPAESTMARKTRRNAAPKPKSRPRMRPTRLGQAQARRTSVQATKRRACRPFRSIGRARGTPPIPARSDSSGQESVGQERPVATELESPPLREDAPPRHEGGWQQQQQPQQGGGNYQRWFHEFRLPQSAPATGGWSARRRQWHGRESGPAIPGRPGNAILGRSGATAATVVIRSGAQDQRAKSKTSPSNTEEGILDFRSRASASSGSKPIRAASIGHFVTPRSRRDTISRDGMWIKGGAPQQSRARKMYKLHVHPRRGSRRSKRTSRFRGVDGNRSEKAHQARDRSGPLHHAHHGFDDAHRQRRTQVVRASAHRQDHAARSTSARPW